MAEKSINPVRAIWLLLAALAVPACLFSQTGIPTDDVTRESLKFTQIYGVLEENYMDPISPDQVILEGGIRGMLASLDPFSAFFNPDQFEMLQEQARGVALGFGSILYVQEGKVVILQTAERSPAWRAGLGPGDEIVEVNGTRIARLDFRSLIRLLQSARSKRVRLGVLRPGRDVPEDFILDPAEVSLPTVDRAFLFSPDIGYIHLSGFEQKTPEEFIQALNRLKAAKLKGLLLDLRDNHGGMIDTAVDSASLFLKPGLLVLTVKGRAVPEKSYRTTELSEHFDMPLIVLVNGDTASAAEILAAALEEHDRALIVGEPTYGKGVVDTLMPLSEKSGLALITAQYFTPSGRSIQRPLPGSALAIDASLKQTAAGADPDVRAEVFHTDDGRTVVAGGGINPDVIIPGRSLDPWLTFLDQRGLFTGFASEYLTGHERVDRSFEPDSQTLDDFRDFLMREGVEAPGEYWAPDKSYLLMRIKAEIFTLEFGLPAGNEVQVLGDPQVQKAASYFGKISSLLKPPPREALQAGIKQATRPPVSPTKH